MAPTRPLGPSFWPPTCPITIAATYVGFRAWYWCQSDSPRGMTVGEMRPLEAAVLTPFGAESHRRADTAAKTSQIDLCGRPHPSAIGHWTQTMAGLLYRHAKKIIDRVRRELISLSNTRNNFANERRGTRTTTLTDSSNFRLAVPLLLETPQLAVSRHFCPRLLQSIRLRSTACAKCVTLIDNSPRQPRTALWRRCCFDS